MTRAGAARCDSPIDLVTLVAYWLGELPEAAEATLEEHVFGCTHCAGRLETLAGIAAGVRAAVQAGTVGLFVSRGFVEAMKQAALRVREYRVAAGGSVNCTLLAEEHAVVARVRAPLAGVQRVDAVQRVRIGDTETAPVRLADVPFDPAANEVLFIPSPAALRAMPAHTTRVQLIAVSEAGDVPLGEYAFVHAPQVP